jgi:hypothetical protein
MLRPQRAEIDHGLPVGYQAIAASGRDKTETAFSPFVEKDRRIRSSTGP